MKRTSPQKRAAVWLARAGRLARALVLGGAVAAITAWPALADPGPLQPVVDMVNLIVGWFISAVLVVGAGFLVIGIVLAIMQGLFGNVTGASGMVSQAWFKAIMVVVFAALLVASPAVADMAMQSLSESEWFVIDYTVNGWDGNGGSAPTEPARAITFARDAQA